MWPTLTSLFRIHSRPKSLGTKAWLLLKSNYLNIKTSSLFSDRHLESVVMIRMETKEEKRDTSLDISVAFRNCEPF